ncbi:helix-turn-helix domain-containing protein [Aerococcaceae bacterium DSM 111176]|nr:helix-turn-helix domain-containing protein [Aerococcaceae bacterium DSM 111176]
MESRNRIKRLREEKGLSLKELGDLIGKNLSTVQRYESGLISTLSEEVVFAIADALEVTPAYLLGWSDMTTVEVTSVPIVEAIVEGEFISKSTIDIALTNVTDKQLTYYFADDAMYPEIHENSLILAKNKSKAEDGSLVVILPDESTQPLVRRLKYIDDTAIFIPVDLEHEVYTVDTASIIGDVVSVTKYYSNFE